MLRTFYLHGSIGEVAGATEFEFDADNMLTLTRALCSQLPSFRQVMIQQPEMLVIVMDEDGNVLEQLDDANFIFPFSEAGQKVHLIPKIKGAGIELVAWYVGSTVAALTAAQVAVGIAINIAASFVVGKIISALGPSPDTTQQTRQDERPSFLFNGAANLIQAGHPVPLVYGTHMVGSIVISAGVDVEDIPYVPAETSEPQGGGTATPTSPPPEPWQWSGEGA